jgi:hypothetical protein
LTDGKSGSGRDLADDHRDFVALDQPLGFGGGGLRVDRVFHHKLDLAAHHPARVVDLVGGELDPHDRVFAERSEKAGERREMSDADGVGLCAHDCRHADAGEHR